MKTFKSSFSKGMLISTGIILLVILFAIYSLLGTVIHASASSFAFISAVVGVSFLTGSLLYAFASQLCSIQLTDDSLIIRKRIGRVVIPRREIIKAGSKKNMQGDVRVFGISGFLGHMGIFWNQHSGNYRAIINDGNRLLEVKTKGKVYVMSCDEREELIDLLSSSHPQASA